MGEARRKEAWRGTQVAEAGSATLSGVASAVRRLMCAASPALGFDCDLHAQLGMYLLGRLGIAAQIVCGFAAWRVGPRDHDVIVHAPIRRHQVAFEDGGGLPAHSWLWVSGRILDLTTYQLPFKAAALDASDGECTAVEWHPDFLWAAPTDCVSLTQVMQGETGLFAYERHPRIERTLDSLRQNLEESDKLAVWTLLRNPAMKAVGPNGSCEASFSRRGVL